MSIHGLTLAASLRHAVTGTGSQGLLVRARVMAIDGFEVDPPDSRENAAELGAYETGEK